GGRQGDARGEDEGSELPTHRSIPLIVVPRGGSRHRARLVAQLRSRVQRCAFWDCAFVPYRSRNDPATPRAATCAAHAAGDAPSAARRWPSWSALRPTATTWAPASWRATAMARPKPRLAPVTRAVVPVRSCPSMSRPPWRSRGRVAPLVGAGPQARKADVA